MTDSTITTEPPQQPAPKKRNLTPWIFAGIGAIVIAAAIAIPVSLNAAQEAAAKEEAARVAAEAQAAEVQRLATFREELASCGVASAGSSTVEILDGGEAVQLQRVTKLDGPTYAQMTCFLKGLDAPSAIEAEIGQTRALDGRQNDEWDGYTISWAYHPDNGASILVKHAD
jgi:type II secretory pathway pseudopilin PulG